MIDVKLLASAHECVTYQLEHANIHIEGVGNQHIAVLLDAAKVYQSAVVSKDAVSAACDQYWIEWDVAHKALRGRDYETIGECMARCLTAAKIHAAHRVNTDTLAGFDGGYDAGWQEAIDACAKIALEQVNMDTGPRAAEIIALAIRALKPPGD